MGKLVILIGNSGAGKTTLAGQMARRWGWRFERESHMERPFQALFDSQHERYGFANQIDYLLLRAEQERAIRSGSGVGVQDGGLEEDFYLFTRLFQRRGYLSEIEYAILERLYRELRAGLPLPELIIALHAPLETLAERLRHRQRKLEIARVADLQVLQCLYQAWLIDLRQSSIPLVEIDTCANDATYLTALEQIGTYIDQNWSV